MTSFRQIEANRRNAQSSTGPKTETGKQRSRSNAVRHGLASQTQKIWRHAGLALRECRRCFRLG